MSLAVGEVYPGGVVGGSALKSGSRSMIRASTSVASSPSNARFCLSPIGALMRVGVERSQTWAATVPTMLIKEGYFTVPGGLLGRTYDISPDGQRFLMLKPGSESNQTAAPSLIVVQHWFEELKRLVPTN